MGILLSRGGLGVGAAACLIVGMLLAGNTARADDTRVVPNIFARQEFNDNIFYSATDTVADNITTLSPGLKIVNRTERLDLSAAGSLHVIRYEDNDAFDEIDYDIAGNIGYTLSPLAGISAGGSYKRDSRPDRDVETTGVALGTDKRDQYSFSTGATYALSERTTSDVQYAYQAEDWENPALYDYQMHQVQIGLTHRLDAYIEKTSARLRAGYANYHYASVQTSLTALSRYDLQRETDMDYYSITAGLQKEMSERITFGVNLGGSFKDSREKSAGVTRFFAFPATVFGPEKRSASRNWNTVGDFNLTWRRDDYTTAGFTGSHDIGSPSGQVRATTRTSLAARVSHRFSYEMTGFVHAGYILNKVDRTNAIAGDTGVETYYFSPYGRYNFTRKLYMEVLYRYSHLQDNITGDDSNQNRLYIGLGAEMNLLD